MKIDELVLLLSTDWFLPYWQEIGIVVDEDKKVSVQRGCREIVLQILGNAEDYFHCDLSAKRKQETYSRLMTLAGALKVEDGLSKTSKEWAVLSFQELTASFGYWLATTDLVRDSDSDALADLDVPIIETVRKLWILPDRTGYRYLDLCWKSMTPWDAHCRDILNSPTSLSSLLKSIFRHKRFMAFASQIREHLTQSQRKQLADWYLQTRSNRRDRWK